MNIVGLSSFINFFWLLAHPQCCADESCLQISCIVPSLVCLVLKLEKLVYFKSLDLDWADSNLEDQ